MSSDIMYPYTNFFDLPEKIQTDIENMSVIKSYGHGEYIFHQGDIPDGVFIIKTGRIILRKISNNGEEIVLQYLKEGCFFGETSYLGEVPYICDALSANKADIYYLKPEKFETIINSDVNFLRKILISQARIIHGLVFYIDTQLLKNAEQSLATRLITLSLTFGIKQDDGIKLDIILSQSELATLVGVSRQIINKYIGLWSSNNIIKISDKRIIILDYKKLEEIASI